MTDTFPTSVKCNDCDTVLALPPMDDESAAGTDLEAVIFDSAGKEGWSSYWGSIARCPACAAKTTEPA